jgi:hypothetical protein
MKMDLPYWKGRSVGCRNAFEKARRKKNNARQVRMALTAYNTARRKVRQLEQKKLCEY